MSRRPGASPPQPPALPRIHLARDHHRAVVRSLVADGAWVRVRRAACAEVTSVADPRARALARIAAVGVQLQPGAVLSHTSAALVWGLPTLRAPEVTHVVQRFRARTGASRDVVRHFHELHDDDVVSLGGVRVTTLERTVVDCAMSEPVRGGVVVADAALHAGADRARCEEIVRRMVGRRGVVRARTVLEVADDGAESAGESLARVALLAIGLPRPETQVPVATRLGTYWADLGWPEARVLAEYDGEAKYTDASRDVVVREKRREDALLDEGWRMLRLTKEDLRHPATLTRRARPLFPGIPLTPRPDLTL